jgi:hypothetical protein
MVTFVQQAEPTIAELLLTARHYCPDLEPTGPLNANLSRYIALQANSHWLT